MAQCGQDDDLKNFNVRWMGRLIEGQIPVGVLQDLPTISDTVERERVSKIASLINSCCVRLRASVDELETARKLSPTAPSNVFCLQSVTLIQEWLMIARLRGKDVRGGHYPSLTLMHLDYDQAKFCAELSSAEIHRIAVWFAVSKRPIVKWAWPNFIASSANVHANLLETYAFALTS